MQCGLYITCSDQAKNGKTLISRLFADLLHLRDPSGPQIYDTDLSGNSIVSLFPDQTELIDLTKVSDQLKLFDQVVSSPQRNHVLDLSDDMLNRFFSIYHEIGFEQGASDAGLEILVHYVIDPSLQSVTTARDICNSLSLAKFLPVTNLAVGDCRQIAGAEQVFEELDYDNEIVMPSLAPEIRSWAEGEGFTWSGFLLGRHDDIPYEIRIVIMEFMESIYDQVGAQGEDFR